MRLDRTIRVAWRELRATLDSEWGSLRHAVNGSQEPLPLHSDNNEQQGASIMKVRALVTLGLWIASSAAVAQELPPPGGQQQVKLESVQEKASYGFGYQIGRTLRNQGLELTLQNLVQGLRDGLGGNQPPLQDQELFSAMQEHQRAMVTRLAMRNKEQGEAFLKANQEKEGVVTLESGLQYQVLEQGTGESPRASDRVKTHYHGTLIDGTVFDSSVEAGEPVSFGVNEVIPGWTEALQRMKVGDKWRIFLPADLGYGVQGAGADIGPNSVLIFDIQLLEIER
jgi:FKBP-type peptidyl-prolyl cis-trans isomerase FklB